MKKFLFLVALMIATSMGLNAQIITKTEGVCHKWEGSGYCRNIAYLLGCAIVYDDETNSQLSNYIFELSAQNSSYECLEDLFVLKNGTCQEMYDFLTHIENWGEQHKDNGVSEGFDGYTLKRWTFGLFGSRIVVEIKDKYHIFKDKDIRNIKKKLVKYAKKNNIILNTSN